MQVGSVQKVDEGSDALGILTCLNMATHAKRPSIQAISSMLLRRCPKEKQSQIKHLLSSPSTALVVSSRILNVSLIIFFIDSTLLFSEGFLRCQMLSPSPFGRGSLKKFQLPKRLQFLCLVKCLYDFFRSCELLLRQEMQNINSTRFCCCALWLLAMTGRHFTCVVKRKCSAPMLICSSLLKVRFSSTLFARAQVFTGAIAGHTTSAVFISLKSPNVRPLVLLRAFSSHFNVYQPERA